MKEEVTLLTRLFGLLTMLSISAIDFVLPDTTNTGAKPSGGRRNTVAAAKREAIKAKNRKEHKRACR